MTELHDLSLIERAMRADSQPPQNAASTPPVPDKPQGRARREITDPMRCPSCKQMVELEWFRRLSNGKPYTWCVFCEAVDEPTLRQRVVAAGRVA